MNRECIKYNIRYIINMLCIEYTNIYIYIYRYIYIPIYIIVWIEDNLRRTSYVITELQSMYYDVIRNL